MLTWRLYTDLYPTVSPWCTQLRQLTKNRDCAENEGPFDRASSPEEANNGPCEPGNATRIFIGTGRFENGPKDVREAPMWHLTSKGSSFTIEQWLRSLALAAKTKGNIRNVMAVIFSCAMRWGLVDLGTNPMTLVRMKGISHRQKEPCILNPEEIQALTVELS